MEDRKEKKNNNQLIFTRTITENKLARIYLKPGPEESNDRS